MLLFPPFLSAHICSHADYHLCMHTYTRAHTHPHNATHLCMYTFPEGSVNHPSDASPLRIAAATVESSLSARGTCSRTRTQTHTCVIQSADHAFIFYPCALSSIVSADTCRKGGVNIARNKERQQALLPGRCGSSERCPCCPSHSSRSPVRARYDEAII